MRPDELARIPPRPQSEFEWEDLLVRVELMPRALRVALEPLDPHDPAVAHILTTLATRESVVSSFLELAAEPTFRHPGESRDPGRPAPMSALPGARHSRESGNPGSDAPIPAAPTPRHPGETRDRGSSASISAASASPPPLLRSSTRMQLEAGSTEPVAAQPDSLVHFVRLRQRNFAMVQRRGLEVWDWSAPIGVAGTATVYQALAHLVEADVQALADLRHLVSEVGSAC